MRRWGIVDHPDSVRKLHARPVPRLGGVAILLAYAAILGLLKLLALSFDIPWLKEAPFSWLTIAAVVVVFGTGLIDDLAGLKPWQKLLGQFAGALIAYASGVQIHAIQTHSLDAWWSLPLTVLWLIVCSNAFNLIDGMDGLAAGVGLLAAATMCIAAFVHHNAGLVIVTLPLCGILLGFLRYNFNPASIFLGDCGSLTIGFLLGCFGVLWSFKSATLLGMTAPAMALAVPLLDAGISVVRRFLRHQPIFAGDRRHLHHRLLDRGLTPRRAVLLLYGGGAVAASLSLLQNSVQDQFGGLLIVLFCGMACLGIQHLGYVEFGAATRLIVHQGFRKAVDAEVRLRLFEQELVKADNLSIWWGSIRSGSRDFGFEGVRLNLRGVVLEEYPDPSRPCWQVRIPLRDGQYINFHSGFDADDRLGLLRGFFKVVEHSLRTKSFLLEASAAVPMKGPQSSGVRVGVHAVSDSA